MRRLVTVLTCAALCLPAGAAAQETNAPPGNAGIDEYRETVPAGSGKRPIEPERGGTDGISAGTRGELESQGADGRLAADLAAGGAPAESAPRAGAGGRGRPGRDSTLPDEGAGSPVRAVVEAVTGGSASDSGMGTLLPILLILTLAGVVAAAIARRRSTG